MFFVSSPRAKRVQSFFKTDLSVARGSSPGRSPAPRQTKEWAVYPWSCVVVPPAGSRREEDEQKQCSVNPLSLSVFCLYLLVSVFNFLQTRTTPMNAGDRREHPKHEPALSPAANKARGAESDSFDEFPGIPKRVRRPSSGPGLKWRSRIRPGGHNPNAGPVPLDP